MRMEKSIKCPGCGREYQEQMAQCACGWDFTEDFVLYPSVSRIPEESEQFHIVEDAYTKKIQEIMGRVEAAYQASLNESKELSRIAQDLEEAENLIKTIIRRDGSDENFEWFGKIYMQKTLIQGKLQRQSSTEIKRNLSGNRKNLDNEEQDKFLRIYREAEEGSRDAQFAVGYMYEQGEGTEIDYNEAAKYYSMAAQKGHEGAQHNLAVLYYTGRGVKQDMRQAYEWFYRAARSGVNISMCMLGSMYENGEYVKKDLKSALYWYQMAYKSGNKVAYDKWQKAKAKIIKC